MKLNRAVLTRAVAVVILAGLTFLGCKSYTSPTNYTGGPGGSPGAGNVPFESGSMNAPASFVHVFPSAGTVGYHCRFHRAMGMVGTVTVEAGAADSAVVAAGGTSFTPAAVSIRPGGYVRWRVTDGTHTVTSN